MINGTELKADFVVHVVPKSEELKCQETDHPDVFLEFFERFRNSEKACGTSLMRLDPGASRIRFVSKTSGATFLKRHARARTGTKRVARDTNLEEVWETWGEHGALKVMIYGPAEIHKASWVRRILPDVHISEHQHDHGCGEGYIMIAGEGDVVP